jgi:hypothetical protein
MYNCALHTKSLDNAEFITVIGKDFLGGLNAEMTENRKSELQEQSLIKHIQVKTMTFDEIMLNYPHRNYIDFMSLDVEGGELSILRTIDFEKYHFGVISIENNEPGNVLIDYMKENGYAVFIELGEDILFVENK